MSNTFPLQIFADDKVCQCDDPVAAEMDGELALMSITTGKYYCLNETSSRIWQLIEKPVAVRDLCQTLQREYSGIEPSELEASVLGHVSLLVTEKLVRVDHAAAA